MGQRLEGSSIFGSAFAACRHIPFAWKSDWMTAGVRYIRMFLQTLKQPHQSDLQHASKTMPVHYPITRSLWHPCMGSTLLPQITSKRLLKRPVPPVASNCSTRLAGQSQTHWNRRGNPRAVARVVRKLCDKFWTGETLTSSTDGTTRCPCH